jgi:hypothetical protein
MKMKKIQPIEINKSGKLFDVKYLTDNYEGATYTVKVNASIEDFVGANEKNFESYLRKSFRHFYNLDKELKLNKRKGRLSINKL